VVAAGLGFAGTAILFFTSHVDIALEGATFGSDQQRERNRVTSARNRRSAIWRKVGLGLLAASFLAQAIAAFLPQ
jgi:hypothetical protein